MKTKVHRRRGSTRLKSRIAIRKRPIVVVAVAPEARANLPHEYKNTFNRTPDRKGLCDLTHCNQPLEHPIHHF